jgi:hypothetical protein
LNFQEKKLLEDLKIRSRPEKWEGTKTKSREFYISLEDLMKSKEKIMEFQKDTMGIKFSATEEAQSEMINEIAKAETSTAESKKNKN